MRHFEEKPEHRWSDPPKREKPERADLMWLSQAGNRAMLRLLAQPARPAVAARLVDDEEEKDAMMKDINSPSIGGGGSGAGPTPAPGHREYGPQNFKLGNVDTGNVNELDQAAASGGSGSSKKPIGTHSPGHRVYGPQNFKLGNVDTGKVNELDQAAASGGLGANQNLIDQLIDEMEKRRRL